MIIKHLSDLLSLVEINKRHGNTIVFTSGGFEIFHFGHARLITESSKIPNSVLIVFVNSDEFLLRKKGYILLPVQQRMEIVDSIKGVDYTFTLEDGSQSVCSILSILKPHIFTKGGDRSFPEQMLKEEVDLCEKIGCEIKYGVGGSIKVNSSSDIVKRILEYNNAGEKT